MAVVEAGAFQVRCGNIGETQPTQCLLPLQYRCTTRGPTCRYTSSQLLTDPSVGVEPGNMRALVPLWTTDALHSNLAAHVEQLSYVVKDVLRTPEDPLMLVLQEAWHERIERVAALATALFEGNVSQSIYLARPSVCWALSHGKPTAVVVDCGYAQTTVVAVCDAYVCRRSIITSPIAGAAVTKELARYVQMDYAQTLGARPDAPAEIQALAVRGAMSELKELWTHVGGKGTVAAQPAEPAAQRFVAPDGSVLHLRPSAGGASHGVIEIARAREVCYEILFRDAPMHETEPSAINLPRMLLKARRNVDIDMQAASMPHLLCGGTALAQGFAARTLAELRNLDACYFKAPPPIVGAPGGAWKGASMSAESSAFQALWITRKEFEEEGTSVLRRKLCY